MKHRTTILATLAILAMFLVCPLWAQEPTPAPPDTSADWNYDQEVLRLLGLEPERPAPPDSVATQLQSAASIDTPKVVQHVPAPPPDTLQHVEVVTASKAAELFHAELNQLVSSEEVGRAVSFILSMPKGSYIEIRPVCSREEEKSKIIDPDLGNERLSDFWNVVAPRVEFHARLVPGPIKYGKKGERGIQARELPILDESAREALNQLIASYNGKVLMVGVSASNGENGKIKAEKKSAAEIEAEQDQKRLEEQREAEQQRLELEETEKQERLRAERAGYFISGAASNKASFPVGGYFRRWDAFIAGVGVGPSTSQPNEFANATIFGQWEMTQTKFRPIVQIELNSEFVQSRPTRFNQWFAAIGAGFRYGTVSLTGNFSVVLNSREEKTNKMLFDVKLFF